MNKQISPRLEENPAQDVLLGKIVNSVPYLRLSRTIRVAFSNAKSDLRERYILLW